MMNAATTLPMTTASCAPEVSANPLEAGVACACTETLHDVLAAFHERLLKIAELKGKFQDLARNIKEDQRGICQFGQFLKSLGGDQEVFWACFERDARKRYQLDPSTLRKIISNQFSLAAYLEPVVSAEIPF